MHGDNRKFRSIKAATVADAALQCSREKAQGRYLHDNDSIVRFARKLAATE